MNDVLERYIWRDGDFEIEDDEEEPAAKSYALKDALDPRDAHERRLRKALEELFAKLAPEIADKLAKGEVPTDEELSAAFQRVIEPQLVEAATAEGLRLAAEVQVQFDPAMVNAAMVEWASSYSYEMVRGLTDTTRKTLQNAISKFASTPGMTRGELEKLLEPAFGAARAEAIAVTEVTRAYSASQSTYQEQLAEMGIPMQKVWVTNNDEIARQCPICWPKHMKPEAQWKEEFPGGPPGHVRCRCSMIMQSVEA